MTVSDKPVRVQVPAGAAFTAVLAEAAAKVAWRNGFDDTTSGLLVHLVTLAADVANSTEPTTLAIELEARNDAIDVHVAAIAGSRPMSVEALSSLRAAADLAVALDIDHGAVTFRVGR